MVFASVSPILHLIAYIKQATRQDESIRHKLSSEHSKKKKKHSLSCQDFLVDAKAVTRLIACA